MDRFFRGIGNRMRGERDEDVAAADVSERTESEEAGASERIMADSVEEIVEGPVDDQESADEDTDSDGDAGEGADTVTSPDAADRVVVTNPDDAAVATGTDNLRDSTVVAGDSDDWILVTDGDGADAITASGSDEPEPEPSDPDDSQTAWNPDVVSVGHVADVNLGPRDLADAVIAPSAADDDQAVHDAVWPGEMVRPEVAQHADLGAYVNTGNDEDDDEDDDDQTRASDNIGVEIPNIELQRDPSLFPPIPEPKVGLLDAARTDAEAEEAAPSSEAAYLDVWERPVTASSAGLLDAARTDMETGEAVSSEPAGYTETQGQKGPQLQGQQDAAAERMANVDQQVWKAPAGVEATVAGATEDDIQKSGFTWDDGEVVPAQARDGGPDVTDPSNAPDAVDWAMPDVPYAGSGQSANLVEALGSEIIVNQATDPDNSDPGPSAGPNQQGVIDYPDFLDVQVTGAKASSDSGPGDSSDLIGDEIFPLQGVNAQQGFIPTGETAMFSQGDVPGQDVEHHPDDLTFETQPAVPEANILEEKPRLVDDVTGDSGNPGIFDDIGTPAGASEMSELGGDELFPLQGDGIAPLNVERQPADLTFEPEPAELEANLLEEKPALIDEQSTANSLTGFGSFELRTESEPATGPEDEAATSMQENVNVVPDRPADDIDFTPAAEVIPLEAQPDLPADEGAVTNVMPGDNITGVWTDMRPLSVSGDDAGEVASTLPDDDDPLDGM